MSHLTATDPRTGAVHSRTTAAAYTHISLRDGRTRWHLSHTAARRAAGAHGRVIPVDVSAPVDISTVDPDATCTISMASRPGGVCGAPAVVSWSPSRGGRLHECADHAVR